MINQTLDFLKNTFDEKDFQLAIRAFREDKYIWEALQERKTLQTLLDTFGRDIHNWTPAHITLISLNLGNLLETISANSNLLKSDIKFKAAAAFETLLSHNKMGPETESLDFACLAAIGIRERWLVLDEIEIALFKPTIQQAPIWKTIGAILYGMVPKQTELVQKLLLADVPILNSAALHAVIAQPISLDEQTQKLLAGLLQLTPYHRSALLMELNQHYPSLAANISAKILENPSRVDTDSLDPYQQILYFIEKTELLKITKQFDKAMPALEQIWDTTTRLQADLAAQLAQAAARGNDQKTATEAINKITKIESLLDQENDTKDLLLAQIHTGSLWPRTPEEKESSSRVEKSASAALMLTKAKHAYQNQEFAEAQHLAQKTYQLISEAIKTSTQSPSLTKTYPPDFLLSTIELLLSVNLQVEAADLAGLSQSLIPNHPDLIRLLSKTQQLIGNFDSALENAYIAAALSPENDEFQKNLINLLLQLEKYSEAEKNARKYISSHKSPTPEDYYLAAVCAFKSGDTANAKNICEKSLEKNQKHTGFLLLLGNIYEHQEDFPKAIALISKAILNAPNEIDPWLEIASLHLKSSSPEQALEKLTSAAEVNPNEPRIYLEMGKIQFEQNNQDKALELLNKAATSVTPETDHETQKEIKIHLGKTLLHAGYLDEAKALLESAHSTYPTDKHIAHLYGRTLLKTRDFETALKALEIPLQAEVSSPEIYLDYATALVELKSHAQKALEYIHRVLDQEPYNERAKILEAHATANTGDHKLAIKLYQQAIETELANTPAYFTELILGIAQSAYQSKQPEVAITFLKEALQKIPGNLELQKMLCKALTLADLSHDANALLFEIYQKHNADLDILIWVADQAIALAQLDFAQQVLHQAVQIAPQKAEIIVRLGYVHLENEQEEEARKTFGKLFSAENADIKELKMAAHALISLGDISSSIPFIEKALELCDYQSNDLLNELTNLHIKSGKYIPALKTIQKHIELEKSNPDLWLKQSDILTKLDRPKAALNAIFEALSLDPKSAPLHARAADLLRQNQEFKQSISHINQAIRLDSENNAYKLQAAEILRAGLMNGHAVKALKTIKGTGSPISFFLLQAEILLDQPTEENMDIAKTLVEKAEQLANTYPRLLAIQSRIQSLEGNEDKAKVLFEKALIHYGAYDKNELDNQTKSTILLSIGEAALALKQWAIAIYLGRDAAKYRTNEPRPQLFLAKIYTLRAEFENICRAMKIIEHAPGAVAHSSYANQAFQSAIQSLLPYKDVSSETKQEIIRWHQRGHQALKELSADQIPVITTAEDLAAYIAANRRAGNPLEMKKEWEAWQEEPIILFQKSLAYAVTNLEKAYQIASALLSSEKLQPISAANFAFIAYRSGHVDEALTAIEHALSFWHEEPNWHALAADIQKLRGNTEAVITHLEQASCLDPENPHYLYDLAQTYLEKDMPGNAVRLLENAIKINPLDAKYWTAIASAMLKTGEQRRALESIEKAIKLAPSSLKPLLVAVDITQTMEDSLKATSYLNQAAALQPQTNEEIIMLTNLMVRQNKPKEALEKLDQLISLSMSPVPLMLQKADLIGKTKGIKEKLKFLIVLAQENPEDPAIFAKLTSSYMENGQPSEAIRTGTYALKNANDKLNIKEKAKLHFILGTLLHNSGQLDQAIDHLTKTIQYTPGRLEAYLQLGKTLQLRREFEKAMEYFVLATEIAPSDPRPHLAAGLLSKEAKNYIESEIFLRRAAALAPKDVNIQRQLAQVIALAIVHQPFHGKA